MANSTDFIKTDKPHSVFSMEADLDYILARLINFSGAAFSSRAAYFSQQALEKYLKAFLIQSEGEYLKTHDLIKLCNECSKIDKGFKGKKFIKNISLFNDFIDLGRYGGEASKDPYAKKTKEIETAGVVLWQEGNIFILDELVYRIRRRLDFQKIAFSDNLLAILRGDNSNFFVGTWKLPIKLKEILILGNKYFLSL